MSRNHDKLVTIQEYMQEELLLFEYAIKKHTSSGTQQIHDVSHHIINSGGKKVRPLIVLAIARACGYRGTQHADLAAMIELVHVATLLHDDVVDEGSMRRGKKAANLVFGNATSILVGDFLYTRSFQIMVQAKIYEILSVMADATNKIAEGELLQLLNHNRLDLTECSYMEIIDKKTAQLFCAAAQVGSLIAGVSPEEQKRWGSYGHNIGMAFQLTDDLLDYTANHDICGKTPGQDLSEGKVTLPIIHALEKSSTEEKQRICGIMLQKNINELANIRSILGSNHSLEYVHQQAISFSKKAKEDIDWVHDSQFKAILLELADFAVHRSR
ncbi:polyprenyl synthetase family protein [Candidatus Ichthyocystis hellenicum]|uniref:polyprenyl synthetase family protein n=1 Tax=Candidatus Ichthyocystis hellenicum TaxID=1561003 RepID=UPI000A461AAE|nr:polyprenyl synthetase family protein [Candidatus Ichthyocystis hellenicum]